MARLGVGADAGGELDGGAEQILVLSDGLAGVEADAYLYRLLSRLVALGERGLDGGGACQALIHFFVYFSGSAINLLWQASEQKK